MIKVVLFDYGGVLSRMLVPQYKVRRLARELKHAGVRVAVLSNMNTFGGWCIRAAGLYRGFSPVILSCREGISKPDPRIYQIAIKKLGVKPEEILFIDNLAHNLPPARAAGMHTIHAAGTRKLIPLINSVLTKENKNIV